MLQITKNLLVSQMLQQNKLPGIAFKNGKSKLKYWENFIKYKKVNTASN